MAKHTKTTLSKVNMATVLEEIKEYLLPAFQETHGCLDIGSMHTLQANPSEIKYLMFHLVKNAFYYRKKDVPPIIKIWMETSIQTQTCEIYVEDNGIGIDEKIVETIFWSSDIAKNLPKGRFGLSLCRKIVEGYGGSITVKRFSGEGSLFIIELPCKIMPEYL